jgi:hypothetical protein
LRYFCLLDNRLSEAAGEWISLVARRACANRVVVDDQAASTNAATAWARVNAFLVEASVYLGALGADNTLRFAGWWHSLVARQTRADGNVSIGQAPAVWPAW